MKVKALFLLLTLYSSLAFSQDIGKNKSWIVKWNPTHTIDFFTFPTITVGIEKRITKSFGVNLEIGNQFYDFRNKNVDTVFNNSKGYKINIEGRHYWKSNRERSGFYNGIQLFYRQNEFTRSVTYTQTVSDETSEGYIDNFGVKKTALGAILVIGYQYVAPCNFVFESYFGGGWMNRNIANYNREFDKNKDIEVEGVDQLVNRASVDLSEASGNTVILTIGLRVGYKF